MDRPLPHFGPEQLRDLLDQDLLVERLRQAFLGSADAPPRMHYDTGHGVFLSMPAWSPGRFTGTKLVTIHRENRARGMPTIHGLYVLFDGETGQPLATMDGGMMTVMRTAAASALAATRMAIEGARTHLLVGAGALAPWMARAMCRIRPIDRVLVWNRNAEAGKALTRTLQEEGIPAESVSDLLSAQSEADIITTATQSTEPLVLGARLRPGTHLDIVGAYSPAMRETDGAALTGAHIIVDTHEGARAEAGDLLQAVQEGAITWDAIAGDLRSLIREEIPGRSSASEVTVFKSVGASIEDLAAASLAWERHVVQTR